VTDDVKKDIRYQLGFMAGLEHVKAAISEASEIITQRGPE